MNISYSYMLRCVANCSGVLDVPADVIAKGDDAVHEYIREHESEATCTVNEVQDWIEEVEGTMQYEDA